MGVIFCSMVVSWGLVIYHLIQYERAVSRTNEDRHASACCFFSLLGLLLTIKLVLAVIRWT